jgi:release factor glutamine methyltransferase
MTIREVLNKATIELKGENIDSPKLKARLLLQFILKKNRQYLMVYDEKELTKMQTQKYFNFIDKIKKGTPMQHITHQQEFMKMDFYVDENVLIPRPDTEILVEEVISIAKKIRAKKILDLCTGSGAIAVSLAKYIKNSEITAVDISSKALSIAKKNAKTNGVESQITFVESDLFNDLSKEKYDIIVSNPPYIKRNIIKTLDKEVQKEPHIALDGGNDGLEFYEKIISHAYEFMKFRGYLCLEIGFDQKEEVIKLIETNELYRDTYSKKDLNQQDRIVITKI